MKRLGPYIAALLVGVAAGVGVGVMMNKPKLEKIQADAQALQAKVDELQAQKEADKAESEKTIQRASQEIARHKNDAAKMKQIMLQVNKELVRAKAELANLKTDTPAGMGGQSPEAVATPQPKKPTAATSNTNPSAKSVEYTVQENDSLWKIAEKELGNGMRYKDILELNPGVTEKQALKIGMKLKIPSE